MTAATGSTITSPDVKVCVFCAIAAGTALVTIVREWPDALAVCPRSGRPRLRLAERPRRGRRHRPGGDCRGDAPCRRAPGWYRRTGDTAFAAHRRAVVPSSPPRSRRRFWAWLRTELPTTGAGWPGAAAGSGESRTRK